MIAVGIRAAPGSSTRAAHARVPTLTAPPDDQTDRPYGLDGTRADAGRTGPHGWDSLLAHGRRRRPRGSPPARAGVDGGPPAAQRRAAEGDRRRRVPFHGDPPPSRADVPRSVDGRSAGRLPDHELLVRVDGHRRLRRHRGGPLAVLADRLLHGRPLERLPRHRRVGAARRPLAGRGPALVHPRLTPDPPRPPPRAATP